MPSSTGSGSRVSPSIPKISFHEPFANRRLSKGSQASSGVIEDDDDADHAQDWTVKVPDEDTWAARERRRSSVWQKIDNFPSAKKSPKNSFSSDKRGSILSLFSHGKDKNGNDVLHSGDGHPDTWHGPTPEEIEAQKKLEAAENERKKKIMDANAMEAQAQKFKLEAERLRAEALLPLTPPPDDRAAELQAGPRPGDRVYFQDRKGSILSTFTKGKDEFGNDVMHSG